MLGRPIHPDALPLPVPVDIGAPRLLRRQFPVEGRYRVVFGVFLKIYSCTGVD